MRARRALRPPIPPDELPARIHQAYRAARPARAEARGARGDPPDAVLGQAPLRRQRAQRARISLRARCPTHRSGCDTRPTQTCRRSAGMAEFLTRRELRRAIGLPWRAAQTLACNAIFARGQLETSQRVFLDQFGLDAPDRVEYAPSSWFFLRRMMRGLSPTQQDVFVDFGSGKGRMVYMAAHRHAFKRVVGVEISEHLNLVAVQNIERSRRRLRCTDVQVVTCEATEFEIPDDLTYAFFFNPFVGDVFREVIDNICRSLDRRPRRLNLLYANPVMHNAVLETGRFELVRSTSGLRRDIPLYRISVYRTTPSSEVRRNPTRWDPLESTCRHASLSIL